MTATLQEEGKRRGERAGFDVYGLKGDSLEQRWTRRKGAGKGRGAAKERRTERKSKEEGGRKILIEQWRGKRENTNIGRERLRREKEEEGCTLKF